MRHDPKPKTLSDIKHSMYKIRSLQSDLSESIGTLPRAGEFYLQVAIMKMEMRALALMTSQLSSNAIQCMDENDT